MTREVNFDGLVGPTHNYGGLSYGNIASMDHGLTVSHPKAAVLQGLEKMKLLMDLGVSQALLPPHDRPCLEILRRLGFTGSEQQMIELAGKEAPALLAAVYSASSMWTANAATVSPSTDARNAKIHFTAANLTSQFHRSLESSFTSKILKRIFPEKSCFDHHEPLPPGIHFSDEGAANHIRLAPNHAHEGIEVFVYGRSGIDSRGAAPETFPARQTIEASQAVSRLHGLHRDRTLFVQQNPALIDAGVFHNDVICVGNENLLMYHSQAFVECDGFIERLERVYRKTFGDTLILIEVPPDLVSVRDAVRTYLFNSQLITLPDGSMMLLAPVESSENQETARFLERTAADTSNPISRISYVNTRQSMRNGGGPACLRLRVVMTQREIEHAHQGVFLSETLYKRLRVWADRHYRESLEPADLRDPALPHEVRSALDELTQILGLGSMYEFQRLEGSSHERS